MTSTKRLKDAKDSDDLPKRRRHSVPPSTPKIETSRNSISPTELATPPAPTRRRPSRHRAGFDWLRLIMNATEPSALSVLGNRSEAACEASLDDLVFVEWPQWDTTTWELMFSECIWMHLFLIASRYGSVVVVEEMLRQTRATQIAQLLNDRQQNALVALCSQPPPEILVFEPRQYRPALLRSLTDNASTAVYLGGAKSTMILDSLLAAAKRRQEEMSIIAAMLIDVGVSPLQPDNQGLTALDYAHKFTHHQILSELDRKVTASTLSQPSLAKETDVASVFGEEAQPLERENSAHAESSEEEDDGSQDAPATPSSHAFEEASTPLMGGSLEEDCLYSPLVVDRRAHRPLAGCVSNVCPEWAHMISNSGGITTGATTVDTEISNEVQTPKGMSTASEHEDDLVLHSCASSLPTACDVPSQKRRGKRFLHASNKNQYAGLSDLQALISLDCDDS